MDGTQFMYVSQSIIIFFMPDSWISAAVVINNVAGEKYILVKIFSSTVAIGWFSIFFVSLP